MTDDVRKMLYEIRVALGMVAEKDNNDIIANSASALSVRLEGVGTSFGMKLADLTAVDRQLIQYAMQQARAKKEVALRSA